jgi:biofilm PGA synthesis N-glycosyltransferase PgaC
MSATYVVVTPVRNDERFLPLTIESMKAQTIPPLKWVIVDDGSTDGTGEIAVAASRSTPWIEVVKRSDRGFRKAGGGVIEAFYEGYQRVEQEPVDYVVKMDGDLSFQIDYFERCFEKFANDPKLGIAGGTICSINGDGKTAESKIDPRFHVRGATKIYRAACWQEIGGLLAVAGWDAVDEIKANMLGWITQTYEDIHIIHHRPAGAAYGRWNDHVKGGLANYIAGYHPLFMLLKCLRRMWHKPYLFGGTALLVGFCKGYIKRVPQVEDKALIQYLRQQQMGLLLFRKSLWR